MWKNKKFFTEKIFREINSLVKPLISRNFCQKLQCGNYGKLLFHCGSSTVWKNEKFTLTKKISRQISYLVILLLKSIISRNFCQKRVRVNFRNFHTVSSQHTVWKSTIKRYHARKFSVNPHNKNILNLLLQIHDFLLFGDVFGSSGLNEFWRLVHMLEFIVKNIFSFNGHN